MDHLHITWLWIWKRFRNHAPLISTRVWSGETWCQDKIRYWCGKNMFVFCDARVIYTTLCLPRVWQPVFGIRWGHMGVRESSFTVVVYYVPCFGSAWYCNLKQSDWQSDFAPYPWSHLLRCQQTGQTLFVILCMSFAQHIVYTYQYLWNSK